MIERRPAHGQRRPEAGLDRQAIERPTNAQVGVEERIVRGSLQIEHGAHVALDTQRNRWIFPGYAAAVVTPSDVSTVESWALAYILADTYAYKLAPPPVPRVFALNPRAIRVERPGRGPEFHVVSRGEKSSGKRALRSVQSRLALIHAFLHHELQAAELMAWAILAFPDAPVQLRKGLLQILRDEIRHMNLYAEYLHAHGSRPGARGARDWFWERVPSAPGMPEFLATLGIGFEGGNLDHAARFAARFRAAGDEEGAVLCDRVGREEIPHVRFAVRWFRELSPLVRSGASLFDAFTRSLPAPLSPIVMRHRPLARAERTLAGLDEAFLDALEAEGGP